MEINISIFWDINLITLAEVYRLSEKLNAYIHVFRAQE
jgi:hypothetical protein